MILPNQPPAHREPDHHPLGRPVTLRLLLSVCLMLPQLGAAQSASKDILTQYLTWFRYYNKLTVSPNWQVQTELELRRYVLPDRLHQGVTRVNVLRQHKGGPSLGIGGTYFLQSLPQLADQPVDRIRPEIRPHQELTLSQPLGKLTLNHRYKVEERFFGRTSAEPSEFNVRFRYKLEAQIPLTLAGQRPVLLRVYDEVMFNAGKHIVNNVFDQNRVYASVQVGVFDHWAVELAYLHWFQQRASGVEFYNRHIARLTVTHSLSLIEP